MRPKGPKTKKEEIRRFTSRYREKEMKRVTCVFLTKRKRVKTDEAWTVDTKEEYQERARKSISIRIIKKRPFGMKR